MMPGILTLMMLVVPLVAFGIFYLFAVALPKQKMSQKLQDRQGEVAALKKRIEKEHNETMAKTNNEINELKAVKEKCKMRQYL